MLLGQLGDHARVVKVQNALRYEIISTRCRTVAFFFCIPRLELMAATGTTAAMKID